MRKDVTLGDLWRVGVVSSWQGICKVFCVGGEHGWDQVVPDIDHCRIFIYWILSEVRQFRGVSAGCVFSSFSGVIEIFSQYRCWNEKKDYFRKN